jgi:hypothetical protein
MTQLTSGCQCGVLRHAVRKSGAPFRTLVLAASLVAGQVSADPAIFVNQLTDNAGLVADIQQLCPSPADYRTIGSYSLTSVNRLPENFGSATIFPDSSNIIRTARTEKQDAVIIFTTAKPDPKRICTTLVVLNSGRVNVSVSPSLRDGNFREHLPPIVSTEVDALLSACRLNPSAVRPDYLHGDYVVANDGTVMTFEDSFNCDSAVLTSISAIDIALKGKSIRAVHVQDKLFLFEVGK